MRVYPTPAEGLRDAQRLAESDDLEVGDARAAHRRRQGGARAAGPLDPEARRGLLRRYGALVESLRGAFGTGEDLGTTPEDMAVIAEVTRYVHGVEEAAASPTPAPSPPAACAAASRPPRARSLGRDDLDRRVRCWSRASATSATRWPRELAAPARACW